MAEAPTAPSPHRAVPYFPGGQQLAFFLLLAAILLLAYYTIRSVLVTLLFAAAVASLSYGPFRHLTRALRGRPRPAAALMVVIILLGVFGPLATLLYVGVRRVATELGTLLPRIPEIQAWLLSLSERAGPFRPALRRASDELASTVADFAPQLARRLSEWAGAAGTAIVEVGAALFLFSVAVYYFFLNGDPWRERLIRLLPIDPSYARAFLTRFRQVSLAVLVGNVGTALLHGVLSGMGYWILGVSAPLLWAVTTAFASFIPLIGTALVWVPLSVALAVSVGWLHGLLLLLYCAVVVGLSDNLARPLLMERRLGVHPLFVFVAVFGGLSAFGVSGLFLGPLIMALTVAALDIYEREEGAGRPEPARR